MKKGRKHIAHDEFMGEWLSNRENAVGYLRECLASGDKGLFLDSIRRVADAQGIGMRGVALAAGLGRESLYRTLSETGNPELGALTKILNSLGMSLTVEESQPQKARRVKRQAHEKPAGKKEPRPGRKEVAVSKA
jgi:probable addiction module antidote protein